jgi:hypothetical protein
MVYEGEVHGTQHTLTSDLNQAVRAQQRRRDPRTEQSGAIRQYIGAPEVDYYTPRAVQPFKCDDTLELVGI